MVGLIVELNCSEHGMERFRIKIVKRFNIPADMMMPKFRSKPKPGGISCLWVGRNVSNREIEDYLIDYLHKRGLWESILRIKMV